MKAKILLVEDDAAQGGQTRSKLESLGYKVAWARNGIEALKLARTENVDLALLDVVLPDMDGLSVCRWLKLHAETREIPIIMLTVRSEVEDRVQGLQVGADDYLPKPFAAEELEARIFAALRNREAQSELRKRNTQLETMLHHVETLAMTDPLTGLFNRRHFTDVLRREFAVMRRYKNPLSCIMIDIDHFKRVNDSYGHEAGDAVLKSVARRLTENLRAVDVAARYGGEEFALLLPHTPKQGAAIVAERMRELLHEDVFQFAGNEVIVTASFGISDQTDADDAGEEALLRAADEALYDAKKSGRDRVVIAGAAAAET